MRILKLRRLSNNTYRIHVHLDITKTDAEDNPLPEYVLRLGFPPKPDDLTLAEYWAIQRIHLRDFCLRVLSDLEATEGIALPGEGDPL